LTLKVEYPTFAKNRGAGFWLKPQNWFAARRALRFDKSNDWRDANERAISTPPPGMWSRTTSLRSLVPKNPGDEIRAIVLADTGEGDRSQYGLLPLIRALRPDFMVIVGDVAYPAGRYIDYIEGFFQPYKDLGIPIWAVPGNHEYYSPHKGREFVEVFCTRTRADDWSSFGLRFVRQPGVYWEIAGGGLTNVNIIGIDTGHSGKLDSVNPGSSDTRQMLWLDARLREADKEKRAVILMFHIPTLVDGKLAVKTRLIRLHGLIANHECVKAVICGHIHNFQKYKPDTFAKAVSDITGMSLTRDPAPHYFVSGGGGAFLSAPPTGRLRYGRERDFPERSEWERFTGRSIPQKTVALTRRGVAGAKLSQTVVDRALASLEEEALADGDQPALMSFLLLQMTQSVATITPVFLPKLGDLYPALDSRINVQNRFPEPDSARVQDCVQRSLEVRVL
jgi:3',5'-cyclic AMP phosphodiesterase CpdA